MNKFEVKEEMGIIQTCFFGETKLEDFVAFFELIVKMELPGRIRILHDHRGATPGLKPADLDDLAELIIRQLSEFEEVRVAYISNSPIGIALAILLKDRLSGAKIKARIFYEKEAGFNWLKTFN